MKHRKHGKDLSGPALEVIKRMVKGEKVLQENSGLSAREWDELMNLINN
jgi:thymidylate synthase (FAD)